MMKPLRPALVVPLLLALFLVLSGAPVRAQMASLVKDIWTGPAFESSRPTSLQTLQEGLFFIGSTEETGSEVWFSDGSGSGTRMLADSCLGPCNGVGSFIGNNGSLIFWLSNAGFRQTRLWRSDGTRRGTCPLNDPDVLELPNSDANDWREFFPYFIGCTAELGCEVWKTDGTRAGTRLVLDLGPGAEHGSIGQMKTVGEKLFFARHDEQTGGSELWVLDARGARRLTALPSTAFPLDWAAWKDRLFFVIDNGSGQELWTSSGTVPGTRQLTSFTPTEPFRGELVSAPNAVYFVADDGVHGEELWTSDGTPRGTRRISELANPQPFGFRPQQWLVEIHQGVLFLTSDGPFEQRPWVTSGSPATTRPVGEPGRWNVFPAGDQAVLVFNVFDVPGCEIRSQGASGEGTLLRELPFCPADPVQSVKGRVYWVETSEQGSRLWRTDGTAKGTVRLASLPQPIDEFAVTAGGRRIFLTTREDDIWVWEQPGGVRQVIDDRSGTASSDPGDLVSFAGRLFFSVCSSGLWESAGTEESTLPRGLLGVCGPNSRKLLSGGSLYLVFDTGNALWRIDSSGNGTRLAGDLDAFGGLTEANGKVFFVRGTSSGSEVWSTDGTPAGTRLAFAIPPAQRILSPIVSDGDGFFLFLKSFEDDRTRLWRSDGTLAGLVPLAELGFDDRPTEIERVGDLLFFTFDGTLWRTDGTVAGTSTVVISEEPQLIDGPFSLTGWGGDLYLFLSAEKGITLWRTNGTPGGTVPVATFPARHADLNEQIPAAPVPMNGRLYFAIDDGVHGIELWATDGTDAGTERVTDIAPGSASSFPAELTAVGNTLFFTAHDGVHGIELWRSDGTGAGTRLVHDIAPEALSSSPQQLTAAAGRLFFTADDGISGRELWSLALAGPTGCQPSAKRLCLRGGRFQVEAGWRDFQGETGAGQAVSLTSDTGYFWFFEPSNVEVVLKVLDGRGLNDHFWVFYGALSSVEYWLTVTDTQTGLTRRYVNPSGQLASVGDTTGFGPLGAFSASPGPRTAPPSPPALVSARTEPAAATGSCQPGPRRLCLNGGRFAVEASWKDFEGNTGRGTAVPLTADTGYFWFFDAANVEVLLKVLDGTPLNGKYWVFYGALSNVEYTLKVTDTQTGAVKEYRNPSGRFASGADTEAF